MEEESRMRTPFRIGGRWYRGNLHTHTTCSDGALTPREMVGEYRAAEYDFLAITDHDVVTPVEELGDKGLLVLSGEEIWASGYELVALGIGEPILAKEEDDSEYLLRAIREQGGIAYLPHPRGYDCGGGDAVWRDEALLRRVFAVEIYNASMNDHFGIGDATALWDAVLQTGRCIWGVAADDAHHIFSDYRPDDVARAFVMVRAGELTQESILKALAAGEFYSSTGLTIEDVAVDEDEVTVVCPGARLITAIGNGACGERRTLVEKPISPARFEIPEAARYLRIECEDGEGRRAWTNPLVWRE